MQRNFTTTEVAYLFGIEPWRVQRLFENGTVPEVEKFGGSRVVPATMLPLIANALRQRRWLSLVPSADPKGGEL